MQVWRGSIARWPTSQAIWGRRQETNPEAPTPGNLQYVALCRPGRSLTDRCARLLHVVPVAAANACIGQVDRFLKVSAPPVRETIRNVSRISPHAFQIRRKMLQCPIPLEQDAGPWWPIVSDERLAVSTGTRQYRFRRMPTPRRMGCTYRSPRTSAPRRAPSVCFP
jgi:hypothetical protein